MAIESVIEELEKSGMRPTENLDLDDIMKASDELMKKMKKVNIIITGKTGVGKSTLINSAFRGNLAETGMGRPVTQKSRWLPETPADDMPLRIYDTVGLELSDHTRTSTVETIKEMIQTPRENGETDNLIHCVWYCVLDASNRVEPAEADFIRDLAEQQKVPVVLVLTQATRKKHAQEFQKKILEDYPDMPVKDICVVLAQDEEEPPTKAYGMDRLVEVTGNCLEDRDLQDSWCNMQRTSLKMKKERAMEIVITTVRNAGLVGATPIPGSDAVVLVPLQVRMLLQITGIFGFPVTKKWATALAGSIMGTAGTTIAGKMFVSTLLKCIPGIGSVAGGVISGATAGALTYALGTAYIRLMENVYDNGKGTETDWMDEHSRAMLSEFVKDALKVVTPENIGTLLKSALAQNGTDGRG